VGTIGAVNHDTVRPAGYDSSVHGSVRQQCDETPFRCPLTLGGALDYNEVEQKISDY
jgi:hypothetical protein